MEVFLQLTFIGIYLNYFFFLRDSGHAKKNIIMVTELILYVAAISVDAMVNDSMSYLKVWNTIKDGMVISVVSYVFAPCFKAIYSNHADDSMGMILMCLIGLYLFTYDYESIFRKPEKEALGRPQIKESGFSMFILALLTLILSSRLLYIHQVFCLVIMNVV